MVGAVPFLSARVRVSAFFRCGICVWLSAHQLKKFRTLPVECAGQGVSPAGSRAVLMSTIIILSHGIDGFS